MKKFYLLLLFITFLTIGNAQIYVDIDATSGSNNGISWVNAYTNLQDAIDAANVNDEIWVAAGTYLPTDAPDGTTSTGATDRNNAFHLHTDIKIYGGFAGTETLLSQRDAATNVTILSGDFNDDDVVTGGGSTLSITNNSENAYHVMITVNLTVAAVIDGLTIEGGNANVASGSVTYVSKVFYRNSCGGMTNSFSSPTIINATFMNNSSSLNGAGMYNNTSSSPTITNSTFVGNNSSQGGGMYNHNSSPTITNTTFENNNSGSQGGGMFNYYYSSPTITNTTFVNNSSYQGGGMRNDYSSPTITNSTFISNNSSYGGGMANSSSSATITNSTFVSNNSSLSGGGMHNMQSSSPTITNNIFWNNTKNGFDNVLGADIENFSDDFLFPPMFNSTPTVTYCLTQENSVYSSGTGIINNQPPLFVNAANGDFSLLIGSPAINTGDGVSGSSANTTTLDLAGNARFDGVIDMGAYEYGALPLPVELLYFYAEKAENGVQLSWKTATEINNDYFDVQWSTDGIDFKSIGQVQGAGTITEIQSYEFLHTPDLTGFGNLSGLYDHYYRLKQVDFDGNFEYSNIAMVNYQSSIVDYPLNIYPNPVTDELNIIDGKGQATIYNLLGQPIQSFTITTTPFKVNTSDFPKGQYILSIQDERGIITTNKFIK